MKKQRAYVELEKSNVSTNSSSASRSLCELSDSNFQQTLEVDEEFIRHDLFECQNFCIWQKNFWSETDLNLSISINHSAEKRFCQVIRYVHTLVNQSENQKLRLRISSVLLHLLFEFLKQKNRSDIHSKRLENSDQHHAATLFIDYLLRCSDSDEWDLMNDETKEKLRRQFHDHKRWNSRCWRTMIVLSLETLLVCEDTLNKMLWVSYIISLNVFIQKVHSLWTATITVDILFWSLTLLSTMLLTLILMWYFFIMNSMSWWNKFCWKKSQQLNLQDRWLMMRSTEQLWQN